MTCTDVAKVTGEHILFLGTDTANWALSQFQDAAQFAKAHGVDSLLVKSADGGNWWYGGLNGYRQIKAVIQTAGINCIPYMYSYGNKFSALDSEIAIMQALMADSGVVCVDMETEWDSQISWASYLCSKIQSTPGVFLVSTWADPTQQNWQGVLTSLNPCVSAYMPQQYDDYLAGCWQQFAPTACLQPTLELTQDVGANNPVAIAQAAKSRGSSAISIWYYEQSEANSAILDQVLAAFPKSNQEDPIVTIDLSNGTVASHFTGGTDVWQCVDTGFIIGHGILGFYQSFGGNALCGLTYLGLPQSNELSVPNRPGVVYQRFERGVVCYDPNRPHVIDNPPGAENSDCYLLHIDSGLGMDPRLGQLATQNAQLSNQVSTLQGEVATLQALPIVANLNQIQTVGQTIHDDVETIMKLAQIQ